MNGGVVELAVVSVAISVLFVMVGSLRTRVRVVRPRTAARRS